MKDQRIPTVVDSLETLTKFEVPVRTVLDVGVLTCTPHLMKAFPLVKHCLFEPVDAHFSAIENNYKDIEHSIHHVALSDSDGEAWQVGISVDDSGKVTHSQISDHEVTISEEPRLVECKPVRKARLDTIMEGLSTPDPWLLKIDVDGHELPILSGSERSLRNASIVVIEAPLSTIAARANHLINHGFMLFDIVDLAYYYETLSQVDLIFVRNDIVSANEHLRPWQTKEFDWGEYIELKENRLLKQPASFTAPRRSFTFWK